MQHIAQLLDSMGPTPDQVAATLRAARVRGMRDSTSFRNPVIRYLNQNLDIGGRLEVSAGGTTLHLLLGGKVKQVTLPVAVQGFLDCFHRGPYPDLEAPAG